MAQKKIKTSDLKAEEAVKSFEQFLGNFYNPREGYMFNKESLPTLKSKIDVLEVYLEKIKDPTIRQSCKTAIERGKLEFQFNS